MLGYMGFLPKALSSLGFQAVSKPEVKRSSDNNNIGEVIKVPDNFKKVSPSAISPGMTADNLPLVRRLGL